MLFLTLAVTTIFLIFSFALFIKLIKENVDFPLIMTSLVFSFFIGSYGYWLIPQMITKEIKYFPTTNFEYAKLSDCVIVMVPSVKLVTFTDISTYNKIDNIKEVIIEKTYNAYGREKNINIIIP